MSELFNDTEKSLIKAAKMLLDLYYSMALSTPMDEGTSSVSLNAIAQFCTDHNAFISGGAFPTILRNLKIIMKHPHHQVMINTPEDIDIWFDDTYIDQKIQTHSYFGKLANYLENYEKPVDLEEEKSSSGGNIYRDVAYNGVIKCVTTNACTYNFNQQIKTATLKFMVEACIKAVEKKYNNRLTMIETDMKEEVLVALNKYLQRLLSDVDNYFSVLPKIQLIYKIEGTPQTVTNTFDFEHVKPYFTLNDRLLYVSKKQFDLILHGRLELNSDFKGDVKHMLKRVEKYSSRGYNSVCKNISKHIAENTLQQAA